MSKADRLGQIFIAPQAARQRPHHLRHLDAVGQAIAIVIPFGINKDLSLILQAAERRCVNNAVTVTLVGSAIAMLLLWIGAAAALAATHAIGSKKFFFACFKHFAGQHSRSLYTMWFK